MLYCPHPTESLFNEGHLCHFEKKIVDDPTMCMCVSAASFFLLTFSTATNMAVDALRGGMVAMEADKRKSQQQAAIPEDEYMTFDKSAKNIPCPGPYFSRSSPEIIACRGIDQFVFEVFEGFFCCTIASTTTLEQQRQQLQLQQQQLLQQQQQQFAVPQNVRKWTYRGQDMLGLAEEDRVGLGDGNGAGIAISAQGTVLAVASRYNDNIGSDAGSVQVYQYGNFGWQPYGDALTGQHGGEYFGFSVTLNHEGTRLAVGSVRHAGNAGIYQGQVRVYQSRSFLDLANDPSLIKGVWQQVGDPLVGNSKLDNFGHSVSFNANGEILAVGAVQHVGGTDLGYVHVYQNTGESSWMLMGHPLVSEQHGNRFGNAVCLNDEGNVIAVGAHNHDKNDGESSGMVQVFHFKRGWNPLGQVLLGEGPGDLFGGSLSLSGDGMTLAVGAQHNNGSGGGDDNKTKPSSGHVRVFQFYTPDASWQQVGPDIDGQGDGHGAGISVSLADNRVAVGAVYASGSKQEKEESGEVRVYEYEPRQNQWVQLGQTLYGDRGGDHLGHSVAFSSRGDILAMSAPHATTSNGNQSGMVRVVEMQPSTCNP